MHGAAMGTDDRHTHRQAKSHVAFAVAGGGFAVLQRAVEQERQFPGGDAAPVVLHNENSLVALTPDGKVDFGGSSPVYGGIFQQVGKHLLDQDRVHGDEQQLVRCGDCDLDLRETPAELICCLAEDFLGRLLLLGKLLAFSANAGDGQQVLHQPDQPLGLFPRILQEGALLLRRQAGGLEHGRGRPHD